MSPVTILKSVFQCQIRVNRKTIYDKYLSYITLSNCYRILAYYVK